MRSNLVSLKKLFKTLAKKSEAVALVLVFSSLTACSMPDTLMLSNKREMPNFIIIYVDDLGYGDLGIYATKKLTTPAIDKLVKSGQSWTNFYSSAAVCSPSRGALLTGNLPVRSGLYGSRLNVMWPGALRGIPDSLETIAETFKKNNYKTGIFGKWHLGDAPESLPTRHGFDEWIGIPYSNDMDWSIGDINSTNVFSDLSTSAVKWKEVGDIYQLQMRNPKNSDWNVPLIRSVKAAYNPPQDKIIERPVNQSLLTKKLTEESVSFMRRTVGNNKSFFLFISHSLIHVPLFRSSEFEGKSSYGLFGDVLLELDWSVGVILAELEHLDIGDDTYVVFTSDNGPWLGYAPEQAGSAGPLRGGKGQVYEGGMRVMTIFKGPEIKPGIVSDLAMDTDIYNTFLSLAGIEPNTDAQDSMDLSGTLKFDKRGPRDFIPYYNNSKLAAFRFKNFKLHFARKGTSGKSDSPAYLFDLDTDVGENRNLADTRDQELANVLQLAEKFKASVKIRPSVFDLQKVKPES